MSDVGSIHTSDIAIIGMSGRFPGARNLGEFWRNLRDGVESIASLSDEELRQAGVEPETLSHPDYVKAAGLLDDVELFDAAFFKFSPREAEVLDPQQRIFMECAWEGFEDAGYDPEDYDGLIGVYAGTSMSEYLFQLYSNPELVRLVGNFQIGLGNDKDNLTTLVSYKLNLKGPSMAIQTACSTSLVAVCVACQSLLHYECDMAIAGGVKVQLPQTSGYFYEEGGIMSPDGHCRAFDAAARGTVGGSGVGVVVLKRLADALADRDFIHAVIKGSAVNNDGALKVGYTAPSVEGQAQVIATAQAVAGIDPRTITYVEAHGTGTDLGDPIEVAALTQAFRQRTADSQFCALGSVKTNIGHLDTAAGVAGLIKTVMALKHKEIPPSLHFEKPNPQIDFANSPFFVNSGPREWATNGGIRRAGVNSFGIGGTNAHIILEEAPTAELSEPSRSEQLLVISAKTDAGLDKATANLLEHLKSERDVDLANVAYTLQVGRKSFSRRRALVCGSVEETLGALEVLDPNKIMTSRQETGTASVAFMFPGQGEQHVNMAHGLYREEPTFREQVDRCSELLRPHLGRDLREVLYPSEGATEEMARQLRQTSLAQPALFVVEYALATLLMEWGVRPVAMIGHSLGEYVAACLAGVFSLDDALDLVVERGRMMQRMPEGAMLAVPLSEAELSVLVKGKLSIAAINGRSLSVISGQFEAVGQMERELAARGIEGRRLQTSHAFHSEMMDPIVASFTERVSAVKLLAPQVPYLSNRTGDWATAEDATNPEYWANHLRHTVRFDEGLSCLLSETDAVLLEVGPGQTLGSLARLHPAKAGRLVLSSMRHRADPQSDERVLLSALGRLWLSGVPVDWQAFHQHDKCRRTPLPTYPFERQRFWIDAGDGGGDDAEEQTEVALSKRPDVADWFYIPTWRRTAPPELHQHAEGMEGSRWLLFSDQCGVGHGLAQRLEQSGGEVVTVGAGVRFARTGERSYEIDPRRREDYHTLFEELRMRGMIQDRIVHLWSITSRTDVQPGLEAFEELQARGFYSLMYVAQELGELPDTPEVRVSIVSNHLQAVTGYEEVFPLKATVLGPCLVIPEEYPHISCQSIDVVVSGLDGRGESVLISQLVAELEADSADRFVAFRGDHRWAQDFDSIRLNPASSPQARLRERGIYLITGGLGGIGFTLAEHLAKAVQARLVLVGRSLFPDRAQWERWVNTHDKGDDTSSKIRSISALEKSGAEVMVVSADVADLEAMKTVIEHATQRFGKIDGVIHAAGIAGGRIIQLQSQEVASRVLAPKVLGALILNDVCKDLNLDFLVLCSSLSSIFGAPGQADYCGANAFLDAFAQGAFSRGDRHVVSVNWDTWQEVGMAVDTVVPGDMEASRAESLQQGILCAEGVEALGRILNTELPQVAVSTMDLFAQLAPAKAESVPDFGIGEIQNSERTQPQHKRPSLSNPYLEPRDDQEQAIASLWQELLGVAQVGVHDNFFELGGHSLLAVQFISRLRGAIGADLTLRDLFDLPTVAGLAGRLREPQEHSDKVTDRLEDVLSLVERLTESEVRALLAEHTNSLEGDY